MIRLTIALVVAFALAACGEEEAPSPTSIGACDTSATEATCVEYGPEEVPGSSQTYCTLTGGEWVASCPVADVVARCEWPESVQYFYAGYSFIDGARQQCELYGEWFEYPSP